ncbi:hypothetical protein EMCRGX_G012410 [Ephydatia muelleri]
MPETSIATITDCVFYNNSAQFGGAISILSKGTVHIATSSFVKNNALVGAAIHARSDRPVVEAASVILLCSLTLVDVIIKENYCSCGDYNDTRGGAMYFSGVNVDIGGSDTGSQIVSNSPQGAIQGIDVSLQLWGRVTFTNNSGENWGSYQPPKQCPAVLPCKLYIDYSNVFTPSAVYAQIKIDGFSNATTNIKLGAQQNVQWIGEECSTVEYQIYGPDNATFNILLSSYPGNAPMVIEITFLPCIAGLTLMTDRCICSDFFTSLGIICDATHGTVTREGTNWIGVYNDGMHYVPALSSTCPLNYCKNIDKVSLIRPGDLCNGGRTGILCGHCSDGQSVVFGSSGCQECSDQWLITILMYAGLGASLVAVLFILNFTVTQGTFYGLIFYANIIQANTTIFFNQSVLRPLEVIVSFINLDLGFPLCFYDGMDDAAKTGLQFVFPTYLLILTITVIVFSSGSMTDTSGTLEGNTSYYL